MDKIKLLMDKYGLPEKVAIDTQNLINIAKAEKKDFEAQKEIEYCNQIAVEKIKDAAPIYIDQPVEGTNFRPYGSDQDIQMKIRTFNPKIKEVRFLIGTDKVTIDDPYLIESIRQHLIDSKLHIANKRKRGRPPAIDSAGIGKVAYMLMPYCPTESEYSKRVFAADIIAIFLPEWNKLDNDQKANDIRNCLNSYIRVLL